MSFTPTTGPRIVPGFGPPHAKLAIVGEALGAEEARQGRPFVGPAGSILEQCLHAAGLIRSDCYITNVVKERPPGNVIDPFYTNAKGFTERGKAYVDSLREELAEVSPNAIVTLGNVATAALTSVKSVTKYRGYVLAGWEGWKVIPTIHPAAALRGQYLYRYLISWDLEKAKLESRHSGIRRPPRELITTFSSVQDAVWWVHEMAKAPRISVDIEVLNYEIALIGLSDRPGRAVSIPLADSCWGDPYVELPLWRAIAELLANDSVKVFQNGIFDIYFLATKCGLVVNGKLEDTMIAHHLCYPDLNKSLAFLGSLYCGAQEYWKDMAKFDSIKDED